jgi:hypothetical protein
VLMGLCQTYASSFHASACYTPGTPQELLVHGTRNPNTTSSFYGLFNDVSSSLDCTASNNRLINPLKSNGYYMYLLLLHTKPLHSVHRYYLCLVCFSQKTAAVPLTALTDWSL